MKYFHGVAIVWVCVLMSACDVFNGDLPEWVHETGARYKPVSSKVINPGGAVGDGVTLNTKVIQTAIDRCAAKGGGRVELKEPGVYLTGALFLKSNVELYIGKEVTLKAIDNIAYFPEIPTRVAGIEMSWPAAIINVIDQKNVAVTGKGVIDGNGKYLWDKYWNMREDYSRRGLRWIVDYDCKRVRSLVVSGSEDVTISDLTFLRAGFWTIQLVYSSYCTVSDVTIRNNTDGHGPSTDGIDIDSSDHILIKGCDIDCNDDNICLKAGRDADGLRVNRPTEYVFIRDCIARKGAGLITCGSETSGDIRYVYCTDSKAVGTSAVLRVKSAITRGGTVEHVYMSHVSADSVKFVFNCDMNWNPAYSYSVLPKEFAGKSLPDHWKVMLQQVAQEKGIPVFKNIFMSDINVKNADTFIRCEGIEQSVIHNVELKNMKIYAARAGTVKYTENLSLVGVQTEILDGSSIEEENNINFVIR